MTSPDMPCRDCGRETCPEEYYMVEREVWREAGMGREGYLCIGCLGRRPGRRLTAACFPAIPPNSLGPELSHYGPTGRAVPVDRLTADAPGVAVQLELPL